jgi:hypothetical protein
MSGNTLTRKQRQTKKSQELETDLLLHDDAESIQQELHLGEMPEWETVEAIAHIRRHSETTLAMFPHAKNGF